MPVLTAQPEQAVAPILANAWAIDSLTIMLPLTAPPAIHIGITAYMLDEQGVFTPVARREADLPQAVVIAAMSQPPAAGATVYDVVRTGFYALAQAAGLIPADAVYQVPSGA